MNELVPLVSAAVLAVTLLTVDCFWLEHKMMTVSELRNILKVFETKMFLNC